MSEWRLLRCDLCETPIGRVLKDTVVQSTTRDTTVYKRTVVCVDCYEKTKPGAKK